jgi:hypothetical protein
LRGSNIRRNTDYADSVFAVFISVSIGEGATCVTTIHSREPKQTNLNSSNYMRLWWPIVCKLVSMSFHLIWLWNGNRRLRTKLHLHVKHVIVYMNVMLTTTNEIINIQNSFKPEIFDMMNCHLNHICVMTCSVTFGLAQRLPVEFQVVIRILWWCYNFCIASCSINEEENESLQSFWVLVIQ